MKKGFTLIELLAVIVILSIILVIAVPQILKVIENSSKDAFARTVEFLVDGAEKNLVTNYDEIQQSGSKIYTIENGAFVGDSIPMSGKLPDSGTIKVYKDGKVSVTVKNNKWCAKKRKSDSKVTIADDIENCTPEGIPVVAPDTCFTIEDGTITDYDFSNPECPRDLIIPETIGGKTVTGLEDYAFAVFDLNSSQYRGSLTSVVMPDTVTYMGFGVFIGVNFNTNECAGELESVQLSSNLEMIGAFAFECNKLTSVEIPGTVYYIDEGAFNKNNLTDVIINEGVVDIYRAAFTNNQITSLTLPSSIEYIVNGAFNNNQLPEEQAFFYKISDTGEFDYTTVVSYGGAEREHVEIPIGIKTISLTAFADNQIKNISIPSSVTTIEEMAFANNQLTSVTIPGNVNLIGNYAFGNNGIQTLTIEEGVKEIHWGVFSDNQITNLSLPSSIEYIGYAAFNNNQLLDNQAFIYEVTSPGVFDNTKIISYGGAKRENVVIPNNVETIGEGAFYSCQLMSVTIPNDVKIIGPYAFYNNQLISITIPNSVTDIGYGAFMSNQLTSVTIGNGIKNINDYAFVANFILEGNLVINRAKEGLNIGWRAFDFNGEDGLTPITPRYLVQ